MVQVLSVMLLLCCVALARSASARPSKPYAALVSLAAAAASTSGSGSRTRSAGAPGSAAASAATGSSSSGVAVAGWQLFAARAPPVMSDAALSSAEEALPGSAVPTDAYTSLKQNYDGLVQFLTLVGNCFWFCGYSLCMITMSAASAKGSSSYGYALALA
jgi:hypothetical protein